MKLSPKAAGPKTQQVLFEYRFVQRILQTNAQLEKRWIHAFPKDIGNVSECNEINGIRTGSPNTQFKHLSMTPSFSPMIHQNLSQFSFSNSKNREMFRYYWLLLINIFCSNAYQMITILNFLKSSFNNNITVFFSRFYLFVFNVCSLFSRQCLPFFFIQSTNRWKVCVTLSIIASYLPFKS